MEPRTPEPSPWGTLIRYWREDAGLSREQCVAAYISAAVARGETGRIATMSVGYWQSVENNWGSTRGKAGPVRGSDSRLARMAAVIPGLTPQLLAAEGQRPRAAKMMEGITGSGALPAPQPPPHPSLIAAMDSDGYAREYAAILERYAELAAVGNAAPSGREMFPGAAADPDLAGDADFWDRLAGQRFPPVERADLIARSRARRGGAPQPGTSAPLDTAPYHGDVRNG